MATPFIKLENVRKIYRTRKTEAWALMHDLNLVLMDEPFGVYTRRIYRLLGKE